MNQPNQQRRINRLTGKPMGVGPFPYSFVVPVIFFSVGIAFVWMLGWISPQVSVFLVFAFMLSFFLLAGKKPWRLYERFHQARKLVRVAPRVDWEHMNGLPMPLKMQRQSTRVKGKRVKTYPVEAEFDLVGYGTATIDNPAVGFYVSHPRRDTSASHRQFAFTFAWEVCGIDPLLVEKDAMASLNALELAFRRLSRQIVVTFEHESIADDEEYQHSIDQQLQLATNPLVMMLLYSQKAKVRSLKHRGAFQTKRTRIFVRIQVASYKDRYKTSYLDRVMGLIDSAGNYIAPLLDQTSSGLNRSKKKQEVDRFKLFVHAYKQYRQLHVLWNDTASLKARPLSVEELWTSDYHNLHNESAPQLNQMFVLSRNSVEVKTRPVTLVLVVKGEPGRLQLNSFVGVVLVLHL